MNGTTTKNMFAAPKNAAAISVHESTFGQSSRGRIERYNKPMDMTALMTDKGYEIYGEQSSSGSFEVG